MTQLLVSVSTVREAELAIEAGVDIVDLKDPSFDALAPVATATAVEIGKRFLGRSVLSAVVGEFSASNGMTLEKLGTFAELGFEYLKVGVAPDTAFAAVYLSVARIAVRGQRIILTCFPERLPTKTDVQKMSQAGVAGIMLDTRDKTGRGILETVSSHQLVALRDECQRRDILFGLAGGLLLRDLPTCLAIDPVVLGMRGGVCVDDKRQGSLDPGRLREAVSMVRDDREARETASPNETERVVQ